MYSRTWNRIGMRTLTLVMGVIIARTVAFADWNQWRGPGRAGKIGGLSALRRWPKQLARQWKVDVGEGHSSPLAVGNRVFIFARQGENEVTRCLDLATGREVWQDRYPAPYELNPAAQRHGKGPKSTPVYADGRLFTLGIGGSLSCLDARTGKVVWRHDFTKQYKNAAPLYGTAMSPLVDNGLLIAHVGGHDDGALAAFDVRTGAARWRWTGDGPGYASPISVTLSGVRQIVTLTQKMIVGVEAATGKLLWSLPFNTPYAQNIVTPVAVGDLLIFSGLQQGTFACRVRNTGGRWAAERVWETREVSMYMSSPVASGNRLYGLSERRRGQMFALDTASGKVLWVDEGRFGENAAVFDAGSSVLALNAGGELVVFQKSGDSLKPAARYRVAEGSTWASPAFAGRRILIKDDQTLALWEIVD
jgi:outer membrane protein assembly factor BamB